MKDYPLIKSLKLGPFLTAGCGPYVSADALERILENCPVVMGWFYRSGFVSPDDVTTDEPPQWQGLVIGTQPIVKESEERKLLAEAAAYLSRSYPLMPHPEDEKYRADIAYRTKKFLGEK